VRWGVIGSGGIARRRTIPEGILASPNAELIAVYDALPAINREVSKQFNAQPAGSLEELLKMELDAVYIASPPQAHEAQAISCARAGKHVLCEKPLGLTVVEAESMMESCAVASVLLGVAFMMRFHSQHQEALRWIREGRLGKLVFGRAQLSCWYPPIQGAWRQDPALGGGGSLVDMGGHCLDLLEMYFGKPLRVSCFTHRSIHSYASEDSAVATLFFESGATAVVDTFFCIPDNASQNRLEIYGSQGSILASQTIGQGSQGNMIAYVKPSAGYDAQQQRSAAEGIIIQPDPINPYQAEIDEFSLAIIEQREPLNNALLGLQSQKVLAACYESAREGRIIKL
jgi:predicted dehydrogenase